MHVLLYQCANLLYYNLLLADILTGYLSDLVCVRFVGIVPIFMVNTVLGGLQAFKSALSSNIVECCLV